MQVEQRAVARAFDGARGGIELAFGQRAVVVRAAVLDGEDLAVAVEDTDLEVLPFDDAGSAGRELGERADVDESAGHVRRRAKSVLDGMNCTDRASGAPGGAGWRRGYRAAGAMRTVRFTVTTRESIAAFMVSRTVTARWAARASLACAGRRSLMRTR